MTAISFDADAANFQEAVIEESRKVPVLVDFWAEWCAPCRALRPILEKLAGEYQGKFLLAKVNSDRNPDLAAQIGVRGIPSVKAFYQGQLVDEFTGALPESAVRRFIEGLLPSPAEELRLRARELFRDGDVAKALALLKEAAAADPENDDVKMDLAEILLAQGRHAEARPWLEGLSPLVKSETRATNLATRIEFAAHAEQVADPEALRSRISADGGDLGARLALARYHAGRKDYEKALEQLLEIIRRDRKFGDDVGRRTMLSLFDLLGNDNDLVGRYRRLLASALH